MTHHDRTKTRQVYIFLQQSQVSVTTLQMDHFKEDLASKDEFKGIADGTKELLISAPKYIT